ncbi:wall-associated receptor kinase 2-like isoform X2 [Phragmites australis]|uniref:wall-associated receptor kinase 2-like isoform X2 n=1 Tax=Phragmites australis TaxID=29695 RepID=UPI002D7734B3|nr:wall-associated receptor kinase 2-like isoform X2 [Phragmites australis]
MDWSLPAGKKLLLLVVAATQILQHKTATGGVGAGSSSLAKPGCPDKCGNVSIPYPFGIGTREGCFRSGFNVTCDEDQAAYLGSNKTFKVFEINLSQGEARVQKHIRASCSEDTEDTGLALHGRHGRFRYGHSFTVSNTKNKFTAIGCATIAVIHGENKFEYTSICGSFCNDEHSIENSTQCTGMGCCQTSIPANLKVFSISFLTVNGVDYSAVQNFSPCSYAFVTEEDRFKFNASYAKSTEFLKLYGGFEPGRGVPMVLDWVVGNETCVEAETKSTYACRAEKSVCINVPNGLGYRCNCSPGYEGNPYLDRGCQDINECDSSSVYSCNGECINTIGSYNCSCPSGTQSKDPKSTPCSPIVPGSNQPQVKVVIGAAGVALQDKHGMFLGASNNKIL